MLKTTITNDTISWHTITGKNVMSPTTNENTEMVQNDNLHVETRISLMLHRTDTGYTMT